ncbi:uncharacterized protein LOC135108970 isoform X2 [Scylla paramamosain]
MAVLAMAMHLLTLLLHESLPASLLSQAITGEPEFAIVVCRDKNGSEKDATGFQRQLRQISVLLKSAASLTSETLIFNIVADSYATYETVTNLTASWPAAYRQRVVFDDFKEVFFPPGTKKLRNLFRPCAIGKLFLAQTFEDKDAMVFLDTDTLFLMPPENLWRKVYEFNPHQVIGIAPCLYMCGPMFKKFPLYGSSGLNTGVLVMNLTRVRAFEGGWTENIIPIMEEYKTKLKLADQDILNILFSNETTAKHLYELGCEWNYRERLCSMGSSKCKRAQQLGVGLLHGAALTFVNGREKKFQMRFVYKILCVLAVMAMAVPLITLLLHESLSTSLFRKAIIEMPEFAIVVCRDKNNSQRSARNFQRQLRQISVLLKSAASLTSETLIFNIVADSYATYETVTNLTASWPAAYRQRVVFDEFKKVFFPPGTKKMKNLFRPCAIGKLFLAQTFEDKDAVVFLDTDTLFLMPPEDLWRKVYEFNPHQVIGIAPCLYMYGPGFKKFPTYGSSGLNTGVLVMNLTRVRAFEGGWTENIIPIMEEYKTKLSLADQDILNILFSNETTAKHLYELGCEWNYREKLCSMGSSKCKSAQQLGVGLLHGAALTFVNGVEKKFRSTSTKHCPPFVWIQGLAVSTHQLYCGRVLQPPRALPSICSSPCSFYTARRRVCTPAPPEAGHGSSEGPSPPLLPVGPSSLGTGPGTCVATP